MDRQLGEIIITSGVYKGYLATYYRSFMEKHYYSISVLFNIIVPLKDEQIKPYSGCVDMVSETIVIPPVTSSKTNKYIKYVEPPKNPIFNDNDDPSTIKSGNYIQIISQ